MSTFLLHSVSFSFEGSKRAMHPSLAGLIPWEHIEGHLSLSAVRPSDRPNKESPVSPKIHHSLRVRAFLRGISNKSRLTAKYSDILLWLANQAEKAYRGRGTKTGKIGSVRG